MTAERNIAIVAFEIAKEAHAGQKRRKGGDYFDEHCKPVGEAVGRHGAIYEAVGYLHDVLEDTDATPEQLHVNMRGCPGRGAVVAAVETLTKRMLEHYGDYMRRVIANPLAAVVKRADIQSNLQSLMREHPRPRSYGQAKDKYRVALLLLECVLDTSRRAE